MIPHGGVVHVAVDCRSVVVALGRGVRAARSRALVAIFGRLEELSAMRSVRMYVQWVPGHCGLQGNEEADELAGSLLRCGAPVSALIDLHLRRAWASSTSVMELGVPADHVWRRCVGPSYVGGCPADPLVSRRMQIELARLRVGRSELVAGTRHGWGWCDSPACPRCGAPLEDLEHLLGCIATRAVRGSVFGAEEPGMEVMCTRQIAVAVYLETLGVTSAVGPRGV